MSDQSLGATLARENPGVTWIKNEHGQFYAVVSAPNPNGLDMKAYGGVLALSPEAFLLRSNMETVGIFRSITAVEAWLAGWRA